VITVAGVLANVALWWSWRRERTCKSRQAPWTYDEMYQVSDETRWRLRWR
jgi:hypothetical protein